MAQSMSNGPVKAGNSVKVSVARSAVKEVRVIDTDIVLVLDDGRKLFIRDGAVQTMVDNEFAVEFSDGTLVSGQELLQSAGSAEITPVAVSGPQDDGSASPVIAQLPQSSQPEVSAKSASGGGGIKTWLAIGTPLVGGIAGGVLGGGGGASTATGTQTNLNVKPATPVITVISGNDQVNAADKAKGIEIKGSSEANASVTVLWGTVSKTATADASGIWTVTYATGEVPADALGTTVSATIKNSAGVSSDPASRTVQIDTQAPEAPAISDVSVDNKISPSEKTQGVAVGGKAEAGSSVEVTWGSVTKAVQADKIGNWSTSFTAEEVPATGSTKVTAIATDAFGNVGKASEKPVEISPAIEITGQITAGPLVSSHGLTVDLFLKNGTILATGVKVNANGVFTASGLAAGVGDIVIARVNDTTAGADYDDEATGAAKDLNALFMAVTTVSGTSQTLNINPITTIAAIKAGLAADGSGTIANAAAVSDANAATAAAFGLSGINVTTTRAVPTNTASYSSTDGLSDGEKIGAVLAALSGVDKNNGGDAQATIAALSPLVDTKGSSGALTTQGQVTLMEGAVAAESKVPGGLQKVISDFVASNASSSNVSIGVIAEDNIVTAPEIADLTVSGVVSAGAKGVQLFFGTRTAAATINGETWSYKVNAADIAALGGDGAKVIQATATLADNSILSTTRLISLKATPPGLPVISQIANETTGFSVNAADKRDGFTATGTADPGTTVEVTFGTAIKSTTALANGTWTMNFAGLEIPATDGNFVFSVRARDAFGNVTAAVTQNVLVDTQAPTLLTFTRVGGDNLIGPGDATSTKFEGTAEADALVSLVFNGFTYTGKAASNTGVWSIPLPASRIPADGAYDATVTVFDAAGNKGVSVTQTVNVDVAAPALPTIEAVADNDFVNKVERDSASGVTLTGKAEAGTIVSIAWGGQSFSTKSNSRGVWNYTLYASKSEIPVDSTGFISVYATDSSGNRSETAKREVTVDTVSQGVSILSVSGDNRINLADKNGTFLVEGIAEKGAFMTVTIGGASGMTETTNAAILDGKWSVTFNPSKYLSKFPLDGSNVVVSATAKDIAGNISEPATLAVGVDTVRPNKPEIFAVSTDDAINATDSGSSVTISGKAEARSTVTLDWGSKVVGRTVGPIDDAGNWSFIISKNDLPDEGVANVIVRVTDAAGNVSDPETRPVTIDLSTSVATIDPVGGDDNIINKAEKDAVTGVSVTGSAEPYGRVEVTIGTKTVNADVDQFGRWTAPFLSGELPGNGAALVSVRAFDQWGNEAPTVRTRPFTVDLISNTPEFTGTLTQASGIRAADSIVNISERNNGITVSGTGEAGGKAYVTINGVTVQANVVAEGTWDAIFGRTQLPETLSGNVSVYVVDVAGNTSSTMTTPITIDTTAPNQPTINAVATDDIVNKAERDNPLGVSVTGKAEAGARVFVRWGDGGVLKEDDADSNGDWEVTFLGTQMNAGGAADIIAYQVDAAGNSGAVRTRPVSVATAPPNAPVIDLNIAGDNRVNITEYNSTTGIVVSGSGVTGNKVYLTWGNILTPVEATVVDNRWSYTIVGSTVTSLFDTTTTIRVKQVNSELNESGEATRDITIDRTAPIGGAITSQLGTAQNDNKTINIEEKAEGLVLSGTAASDASLVRISWTANGLPKSFEVPAVDGSGGKTWTLAVPIADLPNVSAVNVAFSVRSIDAAGNVGNPASVNYTFDLAAPAAPTSASFGGTDNIVSIAEASASSGTNIVVSGGLANNHGASKVVVTWTFGGNTYSQETAVLATATTWSLNWNKANLPSADGTYSATAQTVDGSGNVSATSTPINFTIDRGLPSVPSFTSIGAGGDYVINIAENAAATLDVRGTGGAVGATVYLTIGASSTVVGSSPVGPEGTWTISLLKANYPAIDTVFKVYQIFTNTNQSDSASQAVTLDLSPPPTPAITAPGTSFATDNLINAAERPSGLSLSGTATGGASKVLLTWTTGSTDYSQEEIVSGGAWTASIAAAKLPSGAPNSSITISARAIDAAGNESANVAQQSYIFDTSAPTGVTAVTFAGDNIVNLTEAGAASLNFTGNLAANHGAKKIIIVWNGQTETLDLANETSAVTGWTIPWYQPYLPSSASSTAQIFTEDAAGNRSAAVDRIVTNNRTPATPLTNVVVATDGKINLAESTATNITVTGDGASAGSTVFVTLGGVTRNTTTIGAGGTWTVTIPTASLTFTTNSLALSAYQRNGAGNDSTPVTQTVGVDTAPPAVLTLNDVTPGDSINAAEAGQTITLTGTTDPGITSVSVAWGGGTPKNAVVTTTGGTATWSASFTTAERSALVDGTPVRITVVAADDYGNTKTTFRDIIVDTSPPTGLTVDTGLAADGVNIADAAAGVTISGAAEIGADVVVNWNGRTQSLKAADGTWSVTYGTNRDSVVGIPYDGAAVNLTVTQTDGRGNSQSISQNIRIDTIAPLAPSLLGMSNDYGSSLDLISNGVNGVLVGTGNAGEFVDLVLNGAVNPVRLTVNSKGLWTYDATDLFKSTTVGSQVTIAARSVDSVGNTSGALTNFTSFQRQVQAMTPIQVSALTALPTNNVTTNTTGIQIQGASGADRAGKSVSVGDVNNDGFMDLIIGASPVDNVNWSTGVSSGLDIGETYVIYGRSDWSLQTTAIDLRALGTSGYAIRGELASDNFGQNVAFLGDVNNDNRGDFAVYAINGDNPAIGLNDVGAAYIFFSPGGTPGVLQTGAGSNRYTYSASSMDKAAGFVFRGLVTGDKPGTGIVGAQLNGDDTFSDIVIGIPNYDRPASTGLVAAVNVGAVAVIFGRGDNNYTSVDATSRQNLDINSLVAPGSLTSGQAGAEGFLIRGAASPGDAVLGQSIGTGDFNKDGYADLIISAAQFDTGGINNNIGAAYIIYGKANKAAWNTILTDDLSRPNAGGGTDFGKVLDVTNLTQADGFRIVGEQAGALFGTSVKSAGDVNGDGIEDMIIGTSTFDMPGQIDAGTAYVVFGKAGTRPNLDVTNLAAADGFIIRGILANDFTGSSASGVGDVNGDGYADIVVTAGGSDTPAANIGSAYLILGRPQDSVYGSIVSGRSVVNLAEFGPGDGVMYLGRAGAAWLGGTGANGAQVTAAGDLNKDGFADFVITSPEASAGRGGVNGETYIIFGSAGLGGMTQTGTAQANNLIGGTFNDTMTGLGGADNILTFGGNDTIIVPDLAFNFIDAGAGIDTLRLTGSGDILNVRSSGGTNNALVSGQVAGIERIDLTGAGNNTLQIDANGLLQLSSDFFAGGSGADRLIVTGDSGDRVDAVGFGTSSTGSQVLNGITYNIYSGTGTSGAAAQLWVQQGVTYQVLAG